MTCAEDIPFGPVDRVMIANDVMSVLVHDGYAFAGTWGKTIERIRLSDFAFVDSVNPPSVGGNWYRAAVADGSSGKGYFVADGWPTQIVKIDLGSLTHESTLDLPNEAEKREGFTLVEHDGFLYTAGNGWSSGLVSHHIMKVRLSDFTYIGELVLDSGETYIRSMVVDESSGMLYAVTGNTPSQVIKIDLDDFSRVGALTLGALEGNVEHGCFIDPVNDDLVCGFRTSPAYVVRVDLATFTRKDALTLSEDSIVCSSFDSATRMAYFGINSAPAKVIKVNMQTFTEAGVTAAFSIDENYTPGCALDEVTGNLYVGVMGDNSGVVKVAP